jgi:hypothetical protein
MGEIREPYRFNNLHYRPMNDTIPERQFKDLPLFGFVNDESLIFGGAVSTGDKFTLEL